MKGKKYTEEQIIAVLKEGEAGAKVAELCRKYGMSEATYYNWKDTPFLLRRHQFPHLLILALVELSYPMLKWFIDIRYW